jgi:hypothetical protein
LLHSRRYNISGVFYFLKLREIASYGLTWRRYHSVTCTLLRSRASQHTLSWSVKSNFSIQHIRLTIHRKQHLSLSLSMVTILKASADTGGISRPFISSQSPKNQQPSRSIARKLRSWTTVPALSSSSSRTDKIAWLAYQIHITQNHTSPMETFSCTQATSRNMGSSMNSKHHSTG